jgi:heptosyltransferase-1
MKIAIVKLSALGDIIHAMVVLQFIKKHYPQAQIDWIVDENFAEILNYNPDINQIIPLKIKQAKQQKSLKLLLKELKVLLKLDKYDFVIDMQGLLKSAIIARLIPAKIRVGFDKNSIREKLASLFYQQKISISYSRNTLLRYLTVALKPLNIEFQLSNLEQKKPYLFYQSDFRLNSDNYIIFIINSTWESRNYPVDKFVTIANNLKLPCYVAWNNEKEQQKAEKMQQQSEYIYSLPRLNLDKLKAVIAPARLLIGNDTGPTYMAYGLGVPSITIFGPTPENRIYPTKIHQIIKSNSKVNHHKLNKDDFSIREIDEEKIIQLAQDLLCNSQ